MKHPSAYLRMRVLGAIDLAPGASIRDRIKAVADAVFTDEDGTPRKFTWRTISTWLYRFKLSGVTGIQNNTRSDKGKTRKVSPEQLYVDNGSIYSSSEISLICARVGCILRHAPLRDGAAKVKIERFYAAPSAISSLSGNSISPLLTPSTVSLLNGSRTTTTPLNTPPSA